ncbi:VOC family protein [Halovivax cerinus]|uniref:VOC family protein n=1 Tax=Halovivax cerinus TaxID=1487865 RepID=A0ABD5NJR9_9EURY|nr:VOC family protein [Halovivax cerinus]
MPTDFDWLALEVKYLDQAAAFYEELLDLSVVDRRSNVLRFATGPSALVLRRPTGIPRGGIHTHFACSIPASEYDEWWDRLAASLDVAEERFGDAKSLYCYDPDGNCVELGQRDVSGPGIDGIFEVALEVSSLARSESLYADLGFETVDRGTGRRRVRMDGPVALELWEPHLGIADARGGVHVALGFTADEPAALAEAVAARSCSTAETDDGCVIVDPDGHHLTLRRSA